MAAAPTFVHIDKAPAFWAGSDGIPCIIYPDKLADTINAQFVEQRLSSYPPTYDVVGDSGDNILFYSRSKQDVLDNKTKTSSVFRAPCFYVEDGEATIITNAKFPKVVCVPHSNVIYLIYWINFKNGVSGEPTLEDGTLDTGYARALYMTVGTPTHMAYFPDTAGATPTQCVFDTFYKFTVPTAIITPDQWDETGGEEPVVDVTLGSNESYWLPDP